MPARPFTQRFLHVHGGPQWAYYTVPVGYRAVVRSIFAWVGAPNDGGVAVFVHQAQLFTFISPAADRSTSLEARVVAYGLETIAVSTWGTNCAAQVAGYIFVDTTGPIGEQTQRARGPEVAPLPEIGRAHV